MDQTTGQPSYRWIIVLSGALILAVSMGALVNGFSAFIVPIQEAHGWQRGEVAFVNSSGIIGLAFGGLVMGPLADRFGPRPLILLGSVVLGLSYLLAAFTTQLWQLYAVFFLAGLLGGGAIFPAVMASVGNWFVVGAGLALGLASAGQALGQGFVPFLSSILIGAFGIENALFFIGIFMLASLVPLSLLFRRAPVIEAGPAASAAAVGNTAVPARVVIPTLSAAVILCCTCMSVPLMHLVPLIQDRGFSAEQAGSVIFVMLLVAIIGRMTFGKLSDWIGALPAYMAATAWMTLLVFGFVFIDNLTGYYTYAVIYGFGYAGVMVGILTSVRALLPPARRASGTGIVTMFGWFGHAIGGYLGGALYDLNGDYTVTYALAMLAGVANLVIVANLYRKTRRPDPVLAPA